MAEILVIRKMWLWLTVQTRAGEIAKSLRGIQGAQHNE
jgi:hypothetical protein